MIREIKFRAWDKTTKSMFLVVGLFFDSKDEGEQVELVCVRSKWFETSDPTHATWRKLEEVELMQYTGLKNKNGKEIYEGDVVRIRNSVIGQIGWDYFAWQIIGGGMLNAFDSDDLEVIGNIYENSELLKDNGGN